MLAASGFGLVAGCDCSGGVQKAGVIGAAPARELKMVTTWPKDFPGLGAMAERVAKFSY